MWSEADELRERITGAFYARYPEVLGAVNRDSATAGYLTENTKKMIRVSLDRDAHMYRALCNIACDPDRRANPHVFHNEWEEFAHQLIGYAREALAMPPLIVTEDDGSGDPLPPGWRPPA